MSCLLERPSGSLVVLLATANAVGLPAEGVAIIAGVDRVMDMARTGVNVPGHAIACIVATIQAIACPGTFTPVLAMSMTRSTPAIMATPSAGSPTALAVARRTTSDPEGLSSRHDIVPAAAHDACACDDQ